MSLFIVLSSLPFLGLFDFSPSCGLFFYVLEYLVVFLWMSDNVDFTLFDTEYFVNIEVFLSFILGQG